LGLCGLGQAGRRAKDRPRIKGLVLAHLRRFLFAWGNLCGSRRQRRGVPVARKRLRTAFRYHAWLGIDVYWYGCAPTRVTPTCCAGSDCRSPSDLLLARGIQCGPVPDGEKQGAKAAKIETAARSLLGLSGEGTLKPALSATIYAEITRNIFLRLRASHSSRVS